MIGSPLRQVLRFLALAAFFLLIGSTVLLSQTVTTGGTGFFITSDGYLLTNYHVVEGATGAILITLHDGTVLEAELIDFSPTMDDGGSDLALLKVDVDAASYLELSNSSAAQLFDQVIVMGFPLSFTLGVSLNITGGNITAFRTLEDSLDVLQIDAIVNPGNSGGPVLNESGRVIGVVTSKITELHGSPIQGISFAVPVNNALSLARGHIPGFGSSSSSDGTTLSPRDIISKATPAVVYITWEDVYLEEGVYIEDFSRKREWFTDYWNSSGFMEITQKDEGYLTEVSCPTTASGPFFEVDVLFVEYGDGMAGIMIFPPDDTKWGYAILIDAEGSYAFYKQSPGSSSWQIAKDWTHSNYLREGTDVVNHISIEVTSSYARISFNGNAPTSLNASISLGGSISLAVGTFDGTTTARFDNLKIHEGNATDM
jgi:Trypsin-like peptidase domain